MRGKEHKRSSAPPSARITPAHAGKRRMIRAIVIIHEDHPRPCGEKISRFDDIRKRIGSPPPMRGKGKSRFSCSHLIRITPAHAGKSCSGQDEVGRA